MTPWSVYAGTSTRPTLTRDSARVDGVARQAYEEAGEDERDDRDDREQRIAEDGSRAAR